MLPLAGDDLLMLIDTPVISNGTHVEGKWELKAEKKQCQIKLWSRSEQKTEKGCNKEPRRERFDEIFLTDNIVVFSD